MILLNKEKYYKLIEPLKEVKINHLFAKSVVEKAISGLVYVDNEEKPKTFYIVHPYGMSLLFGNSTNTNFNSEFKIHALNTARTRNNHEWMQVYTESWNRVLKSLFNSTIRENAKTSEDNKTIKIFKRVNFEFNRNKYLEQRQVDMNSEVQIVPTNKQMFAEMKGSVVPSLFWNNADDFIENGIGFSLYCQNKLAATAYSAFIHDCKLELGIETFEEFRGKGFAQTVCSVLIDYCLENNYEPVWACRLDNIGSYKLAQKLGFKAIKQLSYYRLCN